MESEERPTKLRKLGHEPEQATVSNDNTVSRNHGISDSVTNGNHADQEEQVGDEQHENLEPDATSDLAELNTINGATEDTPTVPAPPISKNQLKKQRRRDQWEAAKDDRKAKRKERVVRQRERKRSDRQAAEAAGLPPPRAPKKPAPVTLPVTIVIDCDFDDLMRENERTSLASQITRAYSDNKNAAFGAHLAVCSFGGLLRERFDGVLERHYENWRGVRFLDEDFVAAAEKAKEWMQKGKQGGKLAGPCFGKYAESEETRAKARESGEVVYLSSDSDETLSELKPYSTYIIGGLVDKNREKGICHKRAVQKGVKTARLPIGDYMDMASRKVLATNHVNEIMLRWLECGLSLIHI